MDNYEQEYYQEDYADQQQYQDYSQENQFPNQPPGFQTESSADPLAARAEEKTG
jgi:hypothetical protein